MFVVRQPLFVPHSQAPESSGQSLNSHFRSDCFNRPRFVTSSERMPGGHKLGKSVTELIMRISVAGPKTERA
jgi:hypothetical protein